MKTIKVIDLLNKIANGEKVPEKILFNSAMYRFDKIDKVYRSIKGNTALGAINDLDLCLNDEIEIIEDTPKEDKKIEEVQKFLDKILPILTNIKKELDKVNGE